MERGESGERKSRARGEGEMCGGGGSGEIEMLLSFFPFSLHKPQLFCPQCSCLQSLLRFDRFQRNSTVLTAVLASWRTNQLRASTDTVYEFSPHSQ